MVARFSPREDVYYTVNFSRVKASTKQPVWEATFEATEDTMKRWGRPLSERYDIIPQGSQKQTHDILSTVCRVLIEFLKSHSGAIIHAEGREESRMKLYPRMLKAKVEAALPEYRYWSEWLGDEWLSPRSLSEVEILRMTRKV